MTVASLHFAIRLFSWPHIAQPYLKPPDGLAAKGTSPVIYCKQINYWPSNGYELEDQFESFRGYFGGSVKDPELEWHFILFVPPGKLLDVSPGKLHAMRVSRQLSFMRIGGVIYYDRADIDKMFEKFKTAGGR
jgi:hypothetical protein